MERLHRAIGWHIIDRSLVIDGGWEGQLWFTLALPGAVQVRLQRGTPWSKEPFAPSLSVDPAAWPDLAPPEVTDHGPFLTASFPGVVIGIDKVPLRIHCWYDGQPPEETPLMTDAEVLLDGWQVGLAFRLQPEEGLFGLGEPDQRSGSIPVNQRGRRHTIWHKHLPAPSRMVLPVLISQRGYGLFVDNPWVAEWDLGSDGERIRYTAQGGQLVWYFIAGPALTDVLERYTRLTGRPALAPRWAFGLLQSKFGYRNRAEVEHLLETFRAKAIPLDCIILDLFWFRRMGDLAFDRSAFPAPAGMLRELKEQGIRVIVIEEPYVTLASRLFPEAERIGLLGKRTDGSAYTFPFWAGETALMDFTQPLARQWWADQHKPLIDLGIAGWWLDLNEPEEHPQDMIHQGGIAPAIHNIYPLLMVQALALAYEQHKPEARLFALSRSGWPGIQALGAGQWSGDVPSYWDALANQIPLGLSMALAGMAYWNTDIGGFAGDNPSPELYVRWIQFGAFTPIMRPHGSHQPREPWAFGPEAEAIATRYIRLRYRLLPYTYTLAHEAHQTGLPFMRPLLLHYPHDRRTVDLRDQYLWGRDLLVAPVVTPGTAERQVYLPAGDWYDFWSNRQLKGGRSVTARAPLEILPMFVRAGAIIPLAPERERTGGPWEELTLAVYPGDGPTSFALYEDDGESTAYRSGVYAITRFTCDPAGRGLTVTIGEPRGAFAGQLDGRAYRLAVRMPKRPRSVAAGERTLTPRRTADGLERPEPGWWYDKKRKVLYVKLGAVTGELSVQIG